MSAHNDDLLLNVASLGLTGTQEIFSSAAATTQANALPIIGAVVRVLTSVANQALVLPMTQPGGSGSPNQLTFVVNDSPNSVVVFVAAASSGNAAETMTVAGTGTANGSFTVTSGNTGVFSLTSSARHGRGGGQTSSLGFGWSAALLT